MVYFIFDLDETLAELCSVYYFITSLHFDGAISNLDKAYQHFVKDVLIVETSNEPLGILRPGILDIMKNLKELQKKGKIKNVLIYSNNGDIKSLEFIKDLIHLHVGEGLIKECIHRNHPMRKKELVDGPQLINKTWNVLKNIMINGNTRAATNLDTRDVYFFDDLDHSDLRKKLGMNYYKVPRYDFRASIDRIGELYKNAIYKSNIRGNKLNKYVNIVIRSFSNDTKETEYNPSINGIIQLFKDITICNEQNQLISVLPSNIDMGIAMMKHAINRIEIREELRRIKKYGIRRNNNSTRKRKYSNNIKLEVIGKSIDR